MLKDKYSVDTLNRLIINREKKQIVPDGKFTINKDNSLSYWLNEPLAWREKYSLTQEIKFQGNWELNDNYNLELNLSKNNQKSSGEKITLKGEIFSTDLDTMAFELQSQDKSGKKEFQILKLSGTWSSDESQSIIFIVNQESQPDILKLGASWNLNKNQQINFIYEKINLSTKTKSLRTLNFSGFWEISENNILSYQFLTSSKSRFDFQAQIQTPTIYPQAGKIKYRLGAGIKKERFAPDKIITLYGAWKFTRKFGLVFEMNYGKRNIRTLEFGADINLTRKDKIILSLVNNKRQSLGLNVIFNHKFLKKLDAAAFLKFKILREESAIDIGARIPF